jgi:hypothetical protein
MERGDDIMPVAVNVPLEVVEVVELESPLPPQEITTVAMQTNRVIVKIFFIYQTPFHIRLKRFIKWINRFNEFYRYLGIIITSQF